ncbi:DEAD/DEAH box helicase [Desulfobotulus mexicanus]|uniref:DEAD/DEAH box helicase n=1 Tax=Desulfobotulus mexicanus TaxID=2586642 RepID=A0A5S5MEX9_9BACT|nr:DEAD/DEAH box helicase [Desulfobotulus mexicanus]TYT74185.1 DEAD/DEAH box helicase [Desulfobotulus mexicanus]
MSFDKLGLRAELLKAIQDKGYTSPTPIQAMTIPIILKGRDILARAQTGTGKTDAFALPMTEILSRQKAKSRHPRALVLTPTRELALQVGESIQTCARRVSLRCSVVHGGVGIHPQIDRLKRGIDILVATPGRLLDLSGQRQLNLSSIEFLVFDEADRMLDMGFSKAINEILQLLPTDRRTMLFSATYNKEIRALAAKMLQNPEYLEITPDKTAAESVVQTVHLVDKTNKRNLLTHLILKENWTRVLVFSRTKHGANKLTEKLAAQGIRSAALHGNKSQSVRTRTLQAFKNDEIRVLVATDVAARGLDITHLPYVVNFDMPGIPEDYIHRIGRTGRAGISGIAISLVSAEEKQSLKAIEKLLGQKIPVKSVEGYTIDSDVPDFVLYRPGNAHSEKKVDKEIRDIVLERKAKKEGGKNKTSRPFKGKPVNPPGNSRNRGRNKV